MVLSIVLFVFFQISQSHDLNSTRSIDNRIDGILNCRTGFRCYDDECYPGVCYYDRCRSGSNRNCCCYQCRPGADYACNRQGKRFCNGYTCVNCLNDEHCGSDNNCDQVCSNGECVVRSNLDCSSSQQYCLIGQQKCVNCLGDNHCNKSYCDPNTNICEKCYNDIQCRSTTNCNAKCNVTKSNEYKCFNDNDVQCNTTYELCSINEGICKQKCESNNNCTSDYPFCGLDGSCNQCMQNIDCPNCYATCVTNNNGLYYQNYCKGGWNCHSIANINIYSIYLLVILLFFII